MTTQNLRPTICKWSYINLLISVLLITPINAKPVSDSADWWKPITKKHNITFDSYTIHYDCLIIGDKIINDSIESFTNAIIISNGNLDYWIYKSKSASYDLRSKTLKIYNCTIEKFNKNSVKLEPLTSEKHINYSIDFEKNIATMSTLRLDSEINEQIDKAFSECITASENLDVEKISKVVDDKLLVGFIDNGIFFETFNSRLDKFKTGITKIKKQKITVINKIITILSDESVLLTASGDYSLTTNSDNVINGKFAWTIVYLKINNEWKIVHTHMSNPR
jgi:hypothetical protein